MPVEYDQLESAILRILRERTKMGFNEILEALKTNGLKVTRPKLSRRLKNLVRAGAVTKSVIPGWPPSTSYSLMGKEGRELPRSPARRYRAGWRLRWTLSGLLGVGLFIALTAAYLGGQTCRSLRTDILGKDAELSDLRGRLATATEGLLRAEQRLSTTSEALMDVQDLLGQANMTLLGKDSELAALKSQLLALKTRLRTAEVELTKIGMSRVYISVETSPGSIGESFLLTNP